MRKELFEEKLGNDVMRCIMRCMQKLKSCRKRNNAVKQNCDRR